MNITEIKYTAHINLGDYAWAELASTATLSDGESESQAMDTLVAKVNWHVNKPSRMLEYNKNKALLTSAQATDEMKAKAQAYIDRFDAAKKEVEG